VLAKASTAVWELLQSDEGIGKEITDKVGGGGMSANALLHAIGCMASVSYRCVQLIRPRLRLTEVWVVGRRWTRRCSAWSSRIERELTR
jgi:hypothetical protein